MARERRRLGEILVDVGKITKEDLVNVLGIQKISGKKIGEIIVEEGYLTEHEIIEVLEVQLGIPHIDIDNVRVDRSVVRLLPEAVARRYEIVVIENKDGVVKIAMADPLNIFAVDDVKLYIDSEVVPVIATRAKVLKMIDKNYGGDASRRILDEFESRETVKEVKKDEEILDVTTAPIVVLINSLVDQAVREKASDIHIEPYAEDIRVRIRVDGALREIMRVSKNNLSTLVTRIKIIGGMDISEKRVPQDGRTAIEVDGRDIDMRISTIPTVYGEKVVIRILDNEGVSFSKDMLGFSEKDMKTFDKILEQPYGMLLVTGPTGSGKTTTLYTVLQEINDSEKNIITIEDPVEYKLDGINQVQISQKAGLTFATGLRSVLRQDPDIVMIGEIRDDETASIAVSAAITGHLVLSTLHTNDSPSTIARLIDMGVEPYLLSSAIIGVVSQRLVKVLCEKCKKEYEASYTEKKTLGLDTEDIVMLTKAGGCLQCNKGYKGRKAVHEIMPINDGVRKLIDSNSSIDEIRDEAVKGGMTTLLGSAIKLALAGETSYDEVKRVGFTMV